MGYVVKPVDSGRWDDVVELFGPSGAYSGCWCMWWRVAGREFSANGNAGNKVALAEAVEAGPVGLLKAAPKYAKANGASTLEAYPVDTSGGRMPSAAELYTGTVELFQRAGFEVHERPATGRRVVMRRKV